MFNILNYQDDANQSYSESHLSEWLRSITQVTDHAGKNEEQQEYSSIVGGRTHMYSHYGSKYGSFLEKWEPINMKIHLYYSWDCTQKMYHHTKKALVHLCATTWKQSRCPLTKEWIKKMRYIYTIVYHSDVKKNDIMKFTGKRKEL